MGDRKSRARADCELFSIIWPQVSGIVTICRLISFQEGIAMKPIRYVARLNAHYRSQGFQPYRWTVNNDAPLAPLGKPLSECRITLLTSGGVSHCDARPFNPLALNDLRVDALQMRSRLNAW
jgi:hypothetical protein